MVEKTLLKFVVRNRNGSKSGGQEVSGEIESFDWEKFKNLPNAAAFVKTLLNDRADRSTQ